MPSSSYEGNSLPEVNDINQDLDIKDFQIHAPRGIPWRVCGFISKLWIIKDLPFKWL